MLRYLRRMFFPGTGRRHCAKDDIFCRRISRQFHRLIITSPFPLSTLPQNSAVTVCCRQHISIHTIHTYIQIYTCPRTSFYVPGFSFFLILDKSGHPSHTNPWKNLSESLSQMRVKVFPSCFFLRSVTRVSSA